MKKWSKMVNKLNMQRTERTTYRWTLRWENESVRETIRCGAYSVNIYILPTPVEGTVSPSEWCDFMLSQQYNCSNVNLVVIYHVLGSKFKKIWTNLYKLKIQYLSEICHIISRIEQYYKTCIESCIYHDKYDKNLKKDTIELLHVPWQLKHIAWLVT